jgi:hypothetical protein
LQRAIIATRGIATPAFILTTAAIIKMTDASPMAPFTGLPPRVRMTATLANQKPLQQITCSLFSLTIAFLILDETSRHRIK